MSITNWTQYRGSIQAYWHNDGVLLCGLRTHKQCDSEGNFSRRKCTWLICESVANVFFFLLFSCHSRIIIQLNSRINVIRRQRFAHWYGCKIPLRSKSVSDCVAKDVRYAAIRGVRVLLPSKCAVQCVCVCWRVRAVVSLVVRQKASHSSSTLKRSSAVNTEQWLETWESCEFRVVFKWNWKVLESRSPPAVASLFIPPVRGNNLLRLSFWKCESTVKSWRNSIQTLVSNACRFSVN